MAADDFFGDPAVTYAAEEYHMLLTTEKIWRS
jgi:hypothetical protein